MPEKVAKGGIKSIFTAFKQYYIKSVAKENGSQFFERTNWMNIHSKSVLKFLWDYIFT